MNDALKVERRYITKVDSKKKPKSGNYFDLNAEIYYTD